MSLQSEYYNSLVHHGVKGQKWGVRRFETKDGKLTPAGKERYAEYDGKLSRRKLKKIDKLRSKERDALEAATKAGDKAERANQKGKAKKASKYENEAASYDKTADKYNKKVQKIYKRAEKWAQSKARISEVSKATVSRGKEKVDGLKQRMNQSIDSYVANSPNNKNNR